MAACVALAGAGPAASDEPPAAAPRPNVLVIYTDDQSLETVRVMTNVAALQAEGTTFANAFTTFPVCCPSKASFLTGQYPHNHGVLSNSFPEGGFYKLDSSNTLPVWLQAAGYRTFFVGRYLNEYGTLGNDPTLVPPGWDGWHALVISPNDYCRFRINDNGVVTRPNLYTRDCELVDERGRNPGYQTTMLGDRVKDEILAGAATGTPWFGWLHVSAPHIGGPQFVDGMQAPWPSPTDQGKFADVVLPPDLSINELDVLDKLPRVQERPLLTPEELDLRRQEYAHELESLLSVDAAIGELVTLLRDTGQLDNTIVVFSTDNGVYHGEHRILRGKHHWYDPAIRVPLVIRGPGFPPTLQVQQPVANIDLAPTIVEATGAAPGRVMDGKPLQSFVADPAFGAERAILIEDSTDGGRMGLRTAAWALGKWGAYYELYDMLLDPYQLTSLAANPLFADKLAELRDRMDRLLACAGETCE